MKSSRVFTIGIGYIDFYTIRKVLEKTQELTSCAEDGGQSNRVGSEL